MIGALSQYLFAPEEPRAVIDALADPRTPQALRSRVGQLLVTLGGLPPAAPATLPADG